MYAIPGLLYFVMLALANEYKKLTLNFSCVTLDPRKQENNIHWLMREKDYNKIILHPDREKKNIYSYIKDLRAHHPQNPTEENT